MRLEYGNGAITIGSHADPAPISWPNVFVSVRAKGGLGRRQVRAVRGSSCHGASRVNLRPTAGRPHGKSHSSNVSSRLVRNRCARISTERSSPGPGDSPHRDNAGRDGIVAARG
jgi:hypothetical protein